MQTVEPGIDALLSSITFHILAFRIYLDEKPTVLLSVLSTHVRLPGQYIAGLYNSQQKLFKLRTMKKLCIRETTQLEKLDLMDWKNYLQKLCVNLRIVCAESDRYFGHFHGPIPTSKYRK